MKKWACTWNTAQSLAFQRKKYSCKKRNKASKNVASYKGPYTDAFSLYCLHKVSYEQGRLDSTNDLRYVLDVGQSEDWFALQIATLPCLLGYGKIAERLYNNPKTVRDGNTYWRWIQNYVAPDYMEAVDLGLGKAG
jgi:thiaminase